MTMASDTSPDLDKTRARLVQGITAGEKDYQIPDNPALDNLGTVVNDAAKGRIRATFNAGAETLQGNGVVGGGTFANMLDNAMALSVMTCLEKGAICSTVSLTVNMMRSGAPGHYIAEAEVEKIGRRIAFTKATLADALGRIVASATSSLAIIET